MLEQEIVSTSDSRGYRLIDNIIFLWNPATLLDADLFGNFQYFQYSMVSCLIARCQCAEGRIKPIVGFHTLCASGHYWMSFNQSVLRMEIVKTNTKLPPYHLSALRYQSVVGVNKIMHGGDHELWRRILRRYSKCEANSQTALRQILSLYQPSESAPTWTKMNNLICFLERITLSLVKFCLISSWFCCVNTTLSLI